MEEELLKELYQVVAELGGTIEPIPEAVEESSDESS